MNAQIDYILNTVKVYKEVLENQTILMLCYQEDHLKVNYWLQDNNLKHREIKMNNRHWLVKN